MKKFLLDKATVPNGGFRFTDPETKMKIEAPSWRDLVVRVKAHKQANNLPILASIEGDIEQQLAGILPENFVTTVNPVRSAEVPLEDWPLWALALSKIRKPEDAGIGSTIERTIGPFGGTAFKVWFAATFGQSCGCTERRDAFDLQYNYALLAEKTDAAAN